MSQTGSANRRVVVTGGASGIGAATVEQLVEEGATVAVIDREAEDGSLPAGVEVVRADVTVAAEMDEALRRAAASMGGVDALVASAGMALRGNIEETAPEDWDRVFAVNARGVYLAGRAALPYLREGREPAIVNVASQLGLVANESNAAYCASKGAVIQLTRAMAIDAIGDRVRVNAVCPGATRTPMTLRHYAAEEDVRGQEAQLIGRLIEPGEIAAAIVFLASPAASAMVGEIVVVDGGYTIH
jgi:NAD(P)-dependent dehydrogenase (short-subunit alcohol dehydrogenase family)